MLFVVADADVLPHNRARFLQAATAMVTASRAEEGCLGYDYAWDVLEPNRLRVLERWRDGQPCAITSGHLIWRRFWRLCAR